MADNVVRVIKDTNFTVMSNYHLRDNKLSLKAKGLLSLVLSLPEDWDYTIKGLLQFARDKNDSFAATLKELENNGYLNRERKRNEKGQVKGNKYYFYETPKLNEKFTETKLESPKRENPVQVKKPKRENPVQGKPVQENPVLLNKDILNKEKLNKDITNNLSYQSKDNIDSKAQDENKMIDEIDFKTKLEKVKQQVKYDNLISKYSNAQIDEIIELIAWCLCTSLQSLKINGTSTDIMLMRTKIAQLTDKHIEYILKCLEDNKTAIKNRRNYLLTCIYNAASSFKASKQKDTSYDLNEWEKYAMSLGT